LIDVLKDKTILVTGGSGSLGKAFISHVLKHHEPYKVISVHRSELTRQIMKEVHPEFFADHRFRDWFGDINNIQDLRNHFRDVNYVIHAAAYKEIDNCYNEASYTQATNVEGTNNVIQAAFDCGVQRVIFISTDKAVDAKTTYGKQKAVAEANIMSANYEKAPIYTITRWGNIEGSRGSVIPYFRRLVNAGARELPLTHPDMTRFIITYREAIQTIIEAIDNPPGLILVRKSPSIRIADLITAFDCKPKITGLRANEKIHEVLINEEEARRARDCGDRMFVKPETLFDSEIDYDIGSPLSSPYTSDNNTFLTIDEIKGRIQV
jgi:UDP-N-acetylglucosamine 4,6-dehydratase